jgi:Protein of unknown function (DUF3606)
MSVDRRKRRKPETPQVDVHKPSELRAWARYLGCTQQDVRDAVKVNGVMAVDVRDWLRINTVR